MQQLFWASVLWACARQLHTAAAVHLLEARCNSVCQARNRARSTRNQLQASVVRSVHGFWRYSDSAVSVSEFTDSNHNRRLTRAEAIEVCVQVLHITRGRAAQLVPCHMIGDTGWVDMRAVTHKLVAEEWGWSYNYAISQNLTPKSVGVRRLERGVVERGTMPLGTAQSADWSRHLAV